MNRIIFSIQYAGLTLPVLENEPGQNVTPLKPIADLFGLKWKKQHEKVTHNAFLRSHLGVCIRSLLAADGQRREQTCVLVSRVAAYLMSINPTRVRAAGNEDGAKYLMEKQKEWADLADKYQATLANQQ